MRRKKNIKNCTKKNIENCQNAKNCHFLKIAKNRSRHFLDGQVKMNDKAL